MSMSTAIMFGFRCLLCLAAIAASVWCVYTRHYVAAGWFGFLALCLAPGMSS